VSTTAPPGYEFGPFRLDPVKRLLKRDGETVPLTPKALETLLVLIEHRDRVVDKDDLMKLLWPDTVVEEANLAVNVSLLRKALQENPSTHQYVVTVPGRGYRFVASVREVGTWIDRAPEASALRHGAERQTSGAGERWNASGVRPATGEAPAESGIRGEQIAISGFAAQAGAQRVRRRLLVWSAAVLLLVLVAAVSASVWMSRRSPIDDGFMVRSLAVLPFRPLVVEARDEALELGMADAIITKLSNLRQIIIRPTESVLNYTSPGHDLQEAGRKLRVDVVLAGGIQRVGERLRVTVNLIRVRDGSSIWAETFDEPWSDIFAMQDAISEQVARALILRLTGAERDLLVKRDTDNAAAYREYLIGRHFLARRGREAVKSIQHFERAVELDPGYALAHAALADSYLVSVTTRALPPNEAYPRARAAAVTALQLNPALAEAHTMLAVVSLYYDWDWVSAERAFKHAIGLKPDDATAHQRYALALNYRGRFDDALREIRLARDLDPVSLIINTNVGNTLYWARRYQEAIVELQKALAFDAAFPATHTNLAQVYVQTHAYAEAIAEFKKARLLGGVSLVEAYLAHVYAVSGQGGEARKLLDDLADPSRPTHISPFDIALVYVGLGDHDEAFAWLEKAYNERERDMLSLKVNPVLDPLRSDPRFVDLMRRVGLLD